MTKEDIELLRPSGPRTCCERCLHGHTICDLAIRTLAAEARVSALEEAGKELVRLNDLTKNVQKASELYDILEASQDDVNAAWQALRSVLSGQPSAVERKLNLQGMAEVPLHMSSEHAELFREGNAKRDAMSYMLCDHDESFPTDDHSIAGLVHWLRAQYVRHKEIEDKLAADALERLSALEEALRRIGSMEAFGVGGMPDKTHPLWAEVEGRIDLAQSALSGQGISATE